MLLFTFILSLSLSFYLSSRRISPTQPFAHNYKGVNSLQFKYFVCECTTSKATTTVMMMTTTTITISISQSNEQYKSQQNDRKGVNSEKKGSTSTKIQAREKEEEETNQRRENVRVNSMRTNGLAFVDLILFHLL